ncbi:MAG: hypothetical protein MUF14_10380 [Hyphomonadaceae bacterium]|jgi:hypothetical protein|nr:hypothetical protein [Hyphomonadaceae bacterium]
MSWSDRYVVRSVDGELLVYDVTSRRVSALCDFSARVWRASEGHWDVEGVSERLEADGHPADAASIEAALQKLADADLIAAMPTASATVVPLHNASRRQFVSAMPRAAAAVAMVSVVTTIVAPMPAAAASAACSTFDEFTCPAPRCEWKGSPGNKRCRDA